MVLQGESLARHVMQEHGGHHPNGAMNRQLAAVFDWQQCLANFEDGMEESALQMQGDGECWCSFGAQNEWRVALLPRFLKQCPTV